MRIVFSTRGLCLILQCMICAGLTNAQPGAVNQDRSLDEMRSAYEAILASSPNDASAQAGEVEISERIALEARATGDNNFALKTLLRAQSFAPANARIHYDLGVLEDEMHLFQDADKSLARAAVLGMDDPNLLYAMSRVKLDLGQLDLAEQNMTAYLLQRPDDASAHYALGRVYRQGIKFESASAEFQRCIALQPKQTEGYYQLGETQLARGEFADAIKNFAVTTERNPKHAGALAGTGIAYFRQKQYELAERWLKKSVDADPKYQPAHYYLGLTLGRLGRNEESRIELAEAIRLAAIENRESAGRLRITSPQDYVSPK